MIEIFFTASMIAAFLGGMVAFFAPCCITFLLPSYFAYTFKQKIAILKMTFVFMLGIAAILLPIGLGLAGLAQLFTEFHKELFIVGGLFLLFLGVRALMGKGMGMNIKKTPNLNKHDTFSIFSLGLFSGFASSCCLPVLAGVLALSAISASLLQAFALGWAYVFGMVFPLLMAALFWDVKKLSKSGFMKGKVLNFRIAGKDLSVHSTHLLSSVIFFVTGAIVLALAFTDNITASSSAQIDFAIFIQGLANSIIGVTGWIPNYVIGIMLAAVMGAFIWKAYRLDKPKPAKTSRKRP